MFPGTVVWRPEKRRILVRTLMIVEVQAETDLEAGGEVAAVDQLRRVGETGARKGVLIQF